MTKLEESERRLDDSIKTERTMISNIGVDTVTQ